VHLHSALLHILKALDPLTPVIYRQWPGAQFELKLVITRECRRLETLSIFGRETLATVRCSLQWHVYLALSPGSVPVEQLFCMLPLVWYWMERGASWAHFGWVS